MDKETDSETRLVLEEMRRETRQQLLAMRRAFLTLVDELEKIIDPPIRPRTSELRKGHRERTPDDDLADGRER